MQKVAVILGLLAAGALLGLFAARFGGVLSPPPASIDPACRVNAQSEDETGALRSENQQLRQRVQALTAEQERLAQENDILKQAQQNQQLLDAKKKPSLPDLPPK